MALLERALSSGYFDINCVSVARTYAEKSVKYFLMNINEQTLHRNLK